MSSEDRRRFNRVDDVVRTLRSRKIARFVPVGSRVIDVGCGQENWLIRTADSWDRRSMGIDPALEERFIGQSGQRWGIHELLDFDSDGFDVATSVAVIEHLAVDDVVEHLRQIRRALRSDGRLVLTTPTPRSKPVLEFLAYRLHVISDFEIRDHQRYYNEIELRDVLDRAGYGSVVHSAFQFGMNQVVVAMKGQDD